MKPKKMMKLFEQRTSCRSYMEKEVSDEMIGQCIEAARLAPSACNKQPWRFIIVKDATTRQKICDSCLLPGLPMPWLRKAPVIAVLCAKPETVTHKIAPMLSGVKYELLDCGIAGEHFVLAAEALNLGTCWIGWFAPRKLKKLLGIPRNIKPLSLISLGFPEERSEPRSRLATEEIVRYDHW